MIRKKKLGDCFQANGKKIIDLFTLNSHDEAYLSTFKLCHGLVLGKVGEVKDLWFPHCWIEINNLYLADYSNNNEIVAPLAMVKHRIKEESVKRYTPKEAADKMVETGHYGEWHDMKAEVYNGKNEEKEM